MSDSTGISASTGRALSGWEHVQQSLDKILRTPIGARVMRRDFGSDLPDLVDRKMTPRNVLMVYAAAALAIRRWEPRFRMRAASIDDASPTGRISLVLHGTYFPRGHKGDYTVAEDATARVVFKVSQ